MTSSVEHPAALDGQASLGVLAVGRVGERRQLDLDLVEAGICSTEVTLQTERPRSLRLQRHPRQARHAHALDVGLERVVRSLGVAEVQVSRISSSVSSGVMSASLGISVQATRGCGKATRRLRRHPGGPDQRPPMRVVRASAVAVTRRTTSERSTGAFVS